MSAIARLVVLGLAGGVGIGLAGQALPPLHVLGHELTAVFAIVAAFLQLHLASRAFRWTPEGPHRLEEALSAGLCSVVALAAGTHLVAALANTRHGCDPTHTGLFLWLTWVPLGLGATVLGLALARAGRGWAVRTGLFLAAALLAVAHDEAQGLLGLRVVDPFLGMPLALDQRAGMSVPRVHVLQRGWLLGVALAGWAVLAWRHHRTRSGGLLAAWACGAVVVVTVGWGSRIGVGFDGRARRAELDAVHRSEHFVVHYDRSGRASHELDAITREAEWELHRLVSAWDIPADGLVVQLDVYDSESDLEAVTGVDHARAGGRWIALELGDVFDSTLAHELVHAVDQEVGTPWYRIAIRRGLVEGPAVAWARGMWDLDEAHGQLAASLQDGTLPSAGVLMSPLGFWKEDEYLAYQASGSFVGWLVKSEGIERWAELTRTQDLEGTYGRPIEALDAAWRAWLATVPIDEEAARQARWRFDPARYPGVFSQRCPKLGLATPDPATVARGAANADLHERALALYRQLDRHSDDEDWDWGIVTALAELERHGEVLDALDAMPPAERPEERVRRLDARVDPLAALGEATALRQVLDERLALGPSPELAAIRALLDVEAIAPVVLELVASRDSWRVREWRARELDRLAAEHPTMAGSLALLAAAWDGTPGVDREASPDDRRAIRELLDQIEAHPESCDARDHLVWVGERLVQAGELALAEAVADTVGRHCTDPATLWRLDGLRARLAWEGGPR